jgi:hypothetical protein
MWVYYLYGHLVYFRAIWYAFWLFGIFFPVLVCCAKKNPATMAKACRDQTISSYTHMQKEKKGKESSTPLKNTKSGFEAV